MRKYFNANITKYRRYMAEATDYSTWRDAALELDYLEGNVEWKESYASDLYNYELIYDRLTEMRSAQKERNHAGLMRSLREGLHHDLGNIGDVRLYQRSHMGTKHLIEEYVNQVVDSIDYLCHTDLPEVSLREKLDFFKDTSLSYGRPALLLSGGASLGLFHVGVVKALWERGLLPQVINGSSVGSIVAAMVGAHTDDELPALFDPAVHDMTAWRWLGIWSGLTGKGFMDIKQLEEVLRSNIGEYTFQEAYERSGRSINMSVSPTHEHQKARLLSGFTSPYMLMWSGALASSAVPGIFSPVTLMKKDANGFAIPYMPKLRWVDGSVVSDLPVERLMHLYDVNFTIVSQTNPHIVPFLQGGEQKSRKRSLVGLPWRALKAEAQFHGMAFFNSMRKLAEPEILRQVSGQVYSVLAQTYQGDVTIAPNYTAWHYSKILKNPTTEFAQRMILEGERATWPRIAMIRSHSKISLALEQAVSSLKTRLRERKADLKVISH